MKADDARRLKELEGENARLNKLFAEAELAKAMLPSRWAASAICRHPAVVGELGQGQSRSWIDGGFVVDSVDLDEGAVALLKG